VFESITQSLGKAFSAFRGTGKITEGNIREGMQQVRQALLEADVAYDVVQNFISTVTEKAIGEAVLQRDMLGCVRFRRRDQAVDAVEQAAMAAVSKWKFKPGRKGGKNVKTNMSVPINFHLQGGNK